MKKTQKKVLGLLGLFLVVAVTAFAASMPGPEALAASSVTDTVIIRVVGETPNVEITGNLKKEKTIVNPKQDIAINYENVEYLVVTAKYTDKNGTKHTVTLVDQPTSSQPGTIPLNLNFSIGEFGYGDYVLTVKGTGRDGVSDEASIKFSYVPVVAEVVDDEKTGEPSIVLDYEPDDGTPEGDGKVSTIKINIFDASGKLVKPSPIMVKAPTKTVDLDFSKYGLAAGKYKIEVTAYDRHGNELYQMMSLYYNYSTIPVPDTGGDDNKNTGSPDTGGLFHGLNISRSDYLLTGLITFLIVGVSGAVFIIKRGQKSKKR
ncbi:hypothetical protein IKF28_01455 [Candidatus Saccharibacteria bacterium]|nr:hypothetical protein [Candidatus Saccharibacteria bacterium]MBR3122091.1 hypothetical protein [Candidatus Saccharibacteria bacterium]